jgi:hypothetical protein
MAQMAAAARAYDFGADHAVAGIAHLADMGPIVGFEEAGPAGAGIELGAGAEQRQPAQPAAVDALALVVEEHAAERRIGAVLQQHPAFVGRQAGFERGALSGVGRGQVEAAHAGLRALVHFRRRAGNAACLRRRIEAMPL